ncbi:MAG: Ig-like domain-containing protein [Acidobacteriota bacterium]
MEHCDLRHLGIFLLFASGIPLSAAPAAAQGCNTAPVAVADITDHSGRITLFDALANDEDADGDALSLTIVSESCPGTVTVEDGLLLLTPAQLGVPRNCAATYRVSDGVATRTATVTYTLNELLLFADGFESGGTGAWSMCTGTGC